ncbi:hypothetical protein BKA93DRAFT_729818 [Sparassis latifolia]
MRRSLDLASMLSNDDLADYDVISDGPRSLESSIADLGHVDRIGSVREPEPLQAAKDKFDTVGLSAEDIQAYIQKSVPSSENIWRTVDEEQRIIRVYVDGAFDPFLPRHALQLRQAKLSFPSVYLIVGVFADELCARHESATYARHVDRCELLRHCRWVDEIIPDAPWTLDEQFLRSHRIDYVAIDEGSSVDPAFDKERLRGYDLVKSLRVAIPTRRTNVMMPAEPPRSPSPVGRSAKDTIKGAPPSLKAADPDPGSKEDDAETPFEEPKLDEFGAGAGI